MYDLIIETKQDDSLPLMVKEDARQDAAGVMLGRRKRNFGEITMVAILIAVVFHNFILLSPDVASHKA